MATYQEAVLHAQVNRDSLTPLDFTNLVHWIHRDGSRGCWSEAFVAVYGEHFILYTEHHGYFVYHKEDLIELEEVSEDREVTVFIELAEFEEDEDDV